MELVSDGVQNIAEKGENAGYQNFLLFLHFIQKASSWLYGNDIKELNEKSMYKVKVNYTNIIYTMKTPSEQLQGPSVFISFFLLSPLIAEQHFHRLKNCRKPVCLNL